MSEQNKEVGVTSYMPGTDGFTMACFHAKDVPVGTKLYVASKSPAPIPEQVAQAETAEQASALPPTRGIGVHRNADGDYFSSEDVLHIIREIQTGDGWSGDDWDFALANAAADELARRFRAQGGNTKDESSDLAPTTSTVSAPGALAAADDVWNEAMEAAASLIDPFGEEETIGWIQANSIRALKRTAAQAATDKSED